MIVNVEAVQPDVYKHLFHLIEHEHRFYFCHRSKKNLTILGCVVLFINRTLVTVFTHLPDVSIDLFHQIWNRNLKRLKFHS